MIDTKRLATDAAYWDDCGAPKDADHYDAVDEEWMKKGAYGNCWYSYVPSNKTWLGPLGDLDILGDVTAYIPRPQAPEAEWDGNDMFKSGHRLEARVAGNPWLSGKIMYRSEDGVVFKPDDGGDELFWRFRLLDVEFRPIPTKAQRDRDELARLIDDAQMSLGSFYTPEKAADVILSRYNLEPKP